MRQQRLSTAYELLQQLVTAAGERTITGKMSVGMCLLDIFQLAPGHVRFVERDHEALNPGSK